ncbi:MAG: GNAT family N-acetyltransferase, partial [Bacilli bacterium]|nr:GNAT family N-acetyltransferase [Bacilli bacterium]
MIRIDENKISIDNFNYLTDKVGWGTRDNKIIEEALNNTLYSVSINDDNKIIGYGRIIGDKTIFLYIQDIMVIPEYQGQKVGIKIMNTLLAKVDEYKKVNPNIRTYLG